MRDVPAHLHDLKRRTLRDVSEFPAPLVKRLFDHACRVARQSSARQIGPGFEADHASEAALAARLFALSLEELRAAQRGQARV